MNKKGGVGDFIAMLFSLIVILLILTGFILVSGVFVKFAEEPAGAKVYGKDGEEGDFFVYMDDEYADLRKEIFENALEVGYG